MMSLNGHNEFFEHWMPPKGYRIPLLLVLLLMLMAAIGVSVYELGGSKYVFGNFFYIPIILSGMLFGLPGGIITALICGFIMGPYMPLDSVTHEMQRTVSWVTRGSVYLMVGMVAGFLNGILLKQLERLRWVADHNMHTHLPNRYALEHDLQDAIDDFESPFYLIVMNVHNFDEIADTFGYHATDNLIQQLEARFQERAPMDVILYHYHPSRLAVIAPEHIVDINARNLGADFIHDSIRYENIDIHVEACFGSTLCTGKNITALELIQQADIAAFEAKSRGLTHMIYNAETAKTSDERIRYLGLLAKAIDNQELHLVFQPKVNLATERVSGLEVLLRWESPELGSVPPAKFIPDAEQTELIHPLTNWVVTEAFKTSQSWRRQGIDLKFAINLSVNNLQHPDLMPYLHKQTKRFDIKPEQIIFEITESALMVNPERVLKALNELKASGFMLSIDDFGTGYASLAYLKELPAHSIKIDRTFIKDLATDPGSQEIVKATINMAHNLDLEVVAEGLDDERALTYLREWGCDTIQGYYYGKPMPENEFLAYLQSRNG